MGPGAWLGIGLCLIGFVCSIIALIFWIAHLKSSRWVDPVFWLVVACICYGFALLWGNVGVIFSNAGLTG
jgi:hypothetical protein